MASSNGLFGQLFKVLKRGLSTGITRALSKPRSTPKAKTYPETYPGDFRGRPRIVYSPRPGETPDPGEVVWAWVPFEEDPTRGKDRPSLVIGQDGDWLLAVPLSSVNHDLDRAQEARQGRYWMDIGTGPWDPRGRESQVRLDRIVRLHPADVRRVGGILDESTFAQVAREVISHLGM